MTKSRIAGLLLILGVGFIVLRPGDDSSDSGEREGGSDSSTEKQFQPREPTFLTPGQDYGIAGRCDTRRNGSLCSDSTAQPREYRPQSDADGYRTPVPYSEQQPLSSNGYRFRPLSERERQRIRSTYPDQFATEYYSAPEIRPRPATPAPYAAQPQYFQPPQETYSYRPLNDSQPTRDRYQGPYQRPGWNTDRSNMDPWSAPPDPQWGSTPPTQRMYPNLYRNSGRRFTAR